MATKFPIETDKPVIEVTLPVGRHVLELVVEDSAGLRSAPDTIVITVEKAEVIAVMITPTAAKLSSGQAQQFTADVTGSTNKAVTWSVQESGGGTVTKAGLYTAPSTSGTFHVQATSAADPTKNATATVIVTAITCVAGSPDTPCTGASPTITCVAGAPNTPCSGGSPVVLCTTGSPSVVACSGATPTVVTCTVGGPSSTINCVSASPQVLSCTGASPSIIIRSEQDAEADKAKERAKERVKPADKPEVKPKSKPRPK